MPPRAALADIPEPAAPPAAAISSSSPQSSDEVVAILQAFLEQHPDAALLEDGKTLFDLRQTQHRLTAEHGRCTLHLWSGDRQLVRTVLSAAPRSGSLRLSTQRFGHVQPKTLLLTPGVERREPARREPARLAYLRLLERVLTREFPDWQPEGFRAAMDLERSFGPAYIRGTLVRGSEAWAVIGVAAAESQPVIDGILTLGILWLHHCRERSDGRRLYKGLRLIVPRGTAILTLARLPWMNTAAAAWELFELDEPTENLVERDPADQGNVRTRLLHHPDEAAARERFGPAIASVLALVPDGEESRVEQRLRSPSELAFLLHGLEFARARLSLTPGRFTHALEITVGVGSAETALNEATRQQLTTHIEELFSRRRERDAGRTRRYHPQAPGRAIGAWTGRAAHARLAAPSTSPHRSMARLEAREQALAAQQDPLYRAMPERWLESVLRENLAPLTRSLAPSLRDGDDVSQDRYANDPDPDTRGNRLHPLELPRSRYERTADRLIPRFNPHFAYTQVPAIAGAGDRGMLDLLGVTEDGRLAVLEVKTSDDLQLALQGLDYWIRVRHHHGSAPENAASALPGRSDLQQHGYFPDVALSPLPPRLYLVAPALHIHPATETILRYLSPRVEWSLLALDERWRHEVRVVWRKSGGHPAPIV